ncbi:Hsp70 family protein [Actinomycetes bacterium KLBMP 9759]
MRETIGFGIDLGTTNSAIALGEGTAATVVKNNVQADYTPSAVWVKKSGLAEVGVEAKKMAANRPEDVAIEFKQEMGVAGATRAFRSAGVTRTPVELSAEVLKSLRGAAAQQCEEAPLAAVITMPAAFTLNQNNATRKAAALAGLGDSCPLVQEPTAAAYAFGVADTAERAYWMVFDFGGGTFDAAILTRRDGELLVIDHAGDPHLGGKLIDWALVERLLAPAAARSLGLERFERGNPRWGAAFAQLKAAAENAKIRLSTMDSVELVVDLDRADPDLTLEYTLTRGELDAIAEPFYLRAINLCRDALRAAGLGPDRIDRLLLVGGVTLAPGLRARLADPVDGLGIELDHSQDPSTVVARGAALYAATITLDVPQAPPAAGEFTVELHYDPVVFTSSPPVSGQLRAAAPVEWSGYGVRISNPEGRPPFHGLRVPVSSTGTFITDVQVEQGAAARFTIELTDAAQLPQRLRPDSFGITYASTVFGGETLTNALGIGLADRAFAPLLRKGTTLPARARETFRTSIALRRSDPGAVVHIPVVEGERDVADRNKRVGTLEIRSHDVDVDLPAGSDVEVTFEVDASRIVTVSAEVLVTSVMVDAEIDLEHIAAPSAAELAASLRELRKRLDELRAAHPAAPELQRLDAEQVLPGLEGLVAAAATGDVGAAASAEQQIRDVNAVLDGVERAGELPGLRRDLSEVLAGCGELVDQAGDASDRRELDDLQRLATSARRDEDIIALRKLIERARRLMLTIMQRLPEWEIVRFQALCEHRHRMSPAAEAARLIRQGEQTVAAGDLRALAAVNERLVRLLPPDQQAAAMGGLERGGAR